MMLRRRCPRPMPGAEVEAGRVGPAVRDRVGHRTEQLAIDRPRGS